MRGLRGRISGITLKAQEQEIFLGMGSVKHMVSPRFFGLGGGRMVEVVDFHS